MDVDVDVAVDVAVAVAGSTVLVPVPVPVKDVLVAVVAVAVVELLSAVSRSVAVNRREHANVVVSGFALTATALTARITLVPELAHVTFLSCQVKMLGCLSA